MTETKNELNIYQRLHAVMKAIDYVQKEDKKVNNQYTFVSHDAVTAKCRKEFVEHGILSIPSVTNHEAVVGTTKKKVYIAGKESYIDEEITKTILTVNVDFVNIDNPHEKISTVSMGYGLDNQDKGVGKAYSYAVKYAYLKVLGLETGDDPERDIIDFTTKTTLEKAFEPPAKNLDRVTQEQMHATAMNLLGACATLDRLQTVWTENGKKWAKLDQDLFADIEQKKNECKLDITRENNQRNGDLA